MKKVQKFKAFSEINAEERKFEEDPRHVLDNFQSQNAEERKIPESQAQQEKPKKFKTDKNYPSFSLQEEKDVQPQDIDSIINAQFSNNAPENSS